MRFYTIPETAELLHCSVSTVRRRIRMGDLKAKKNGKIILISQEEIDNLINVTEIERDETNYTPIERIEKLTSYLKNAISETERQIAEDKQILEFLDNNELWDFVCDTSNFSHASDPRTYLQCFRICLKQCENAHTALLAESETALECLAKAIEAINNIS